MKKSAIRLIKKKIPVIKIISKKRQTRDNLTPFSSCHNNILFYMLSTIVNSNKNKKKKQ